MKHALPLIALALCFNPATAQTPACAWARSAGGDEGTEGHATATDADGNVFVTGIFTAENTTFGSTTLPHDNGPDAFLAKYDAAGNVLWARAVTGMWQEFAYGLATDAEGNAIIVGSFASPISSFGDTTIINPSDNIHGFVAKYDPDGNVLWARSFGGNFLEELYDVTADSDGNIYAVGEFGSTDITFAGETLIPGSSPLSAVLLKYGPDGDELWARTGIGDHTAVGESVATDGSGNVVLGGAFYCDVLDLGEVQLTIVGNEDGFLVKYDGSGTLLWARQVLGDESNQEIMGIATDPAGNIGITGTFTGDSLVFGSTTLINSDVGAETYIAKFSADGDPLWALAGEGGSNYPLSMTCDGNGDFAVAGYFENYALSFGSFNLDPDDYPYNMFVVKCSSSGAFQWAFSDATSEGQAQAWGITADPSGAIVFCGWFSDTEITFEGTTLTNPNSEGTALFVAKMDGATGVLETAPKAPIRMWPNPASDQCTLDLPRGTHATVTISDGQGRIIISRRISGADAAVDVSKLAPGAYTVQVIPSEQRLLSRLVVAR